DVYVVASANPEDYTNRGRIITPLKDRFGAQIRTHYPRNIDDEIRIVEQERTAFQDRDLSVVMPDFMKEIVAEVSQLARRSSKFNEQSQRVDNDHTIEASEGQASERYTTMLRELPGMEKAFKSLGLDKRPSLAASGVEFILEALHLSKRINKTEMDGAAIYAG